MVDLVPHEDQLPPEQVAAESRRVVPERGEPADPLEERPERGEVGGDLALDLVEAGEKEVGGEERLVGPGEPDGRREPGQVVRERLELARRRLPLLPVGPVLDPCKERGERGGVEVLEKPSTATTQSRTSTNGVRSWTGELGRGVPGPGAVEDPFDPDALELAEVGEGEEDHERERGRVAWVRSTISASPSSTAPQMASKQAQRPASESTSGSGITVSSPGPVSPGAKTTISSGSKRTTRAPATVRAVQARSSQTQTVSAGAPSVGAKVRSVVIDRRRGCRGAARRAR